MKKDPLLMELSRTLRRAAQEVSNIAGLNEPADAKRNAAGMLISTLIQGFIQKAQAEPHPKSDLQVQAEDLLKEVTGQDISLDIPSSAGFKKGKPLTYGQVKILAQTKGKAWCEYSDYKDGSDTEGVWEVWDTDTTNCVMLLQGIFGLELDFNEQPCDDSDVCDYENEYFRAVLFEAVPVKEK